MTVVSFFFRSSSSSAQRFCRLLILFPKTLLARSWPCSTEAPFTHSQPPLLVRQNLTNNIPSTTFLTSLYVCNSLAGSLLRVLPTSFFFFFPKILQHLIRQMSFSRSEAEIDVRMREEFSKVCFETLLQFSFSNKVSTPQEGYISRMALSVLLKRSQDVLRRYVEDERLSGRCPLPR